MGKDEFEKVYNKHFHPLYLYALSLAKNKDDALDLVENTFVKAFLSYNDTTHNIQYWLFRVLRNEYIDLVRKRKKLVTYDFQFEWVEDPYNFTKEIIKNEQSAWLYSEILKLPLLPRQVMLFTLELDDKNIAELSNISIENVRTIRYRTKNKLKQKAKKENML